MQHKEIQRWMDGGPDLPNVLGDAVRAARAAAPSEEQLQRLVERATSATGASASSKPEAPWSAFGAAGGAALVVGFAVLWLYGSGQSKKPAVRPEHDRHETPAVPSLEPSVQKAARARDESATVVEPPSAAASPTANTRAITAGQAASGRTIGRPPPSAARVAHAGVSTQGPREPASAGAAADPTAEIRLLQEAKRDLARAPTRAYQRLVEHEQRYRVSSFVEERAALVVEALVRLGRMPEARRRADDFQKRFPTSAYWRRISEVLQKSTQL